MCIRGIVTTAYKFTCLLLLGERALLHVQQIGFLSHWDPYAVISLEAVAYSSYCNTVEWLCRWVGLKPISVANWLPSVHLHCWLGHLTCKNRP